MTKTAPLAVASLLFVACTGGTPLGPSIHVNLRQISDVHIQPVPEGPSVSLGRVPPRGGYPLEQILKFIPEPLPAPIPQSCDQGGTLTIKLESGREIDYGPCKRPVEIEQLWWHIDDVLSDGRCRPNSWPGGDGPPGESVPPDVVST